MATSANLNVVESILKICRIEISNQGDYVCTAEDGTATSTNSTIMVTVLTSKLHVCLTISIACATITV